MLNRGCAITIDTTRHKSLTRMEGGMKMKRIVACSLLVAGILYAGVPIQAESGNSGATAVLKQLYNWYLRQPNHEWTRHIAQVKPLFDPRLYTMFVTVLHSEANKREAIIDFDPLVNAQWDAVSYALGAPQMKTNGVNVPVTLKLSGRGTTRTNLTAVLHKNSAGHYVIYNLVYDPKFNLRDFLSQQLKK